MDVGFVKDKIGKENLGLQLMRDWANIIGAEIDIESCIGGPTVISVKKEGATIYDQKG